jgi:hypothetical protein
VHFVHHIDTPARKPRNRTLQRPKMTALKNRRKVLWLMAEMAVMRLGITLPLDNWPANC